MEGGVELAEQRERTCFAFFVSVRDLIVRTTDLTNLVVSTRRCLVLREFFSSYETGHSPIKGTPVFVERPKGRKTGPSPRRNGHTATAPPPRPGRPHQRSQPPNQPKNSIWAGSQTPRSPLGRMVAIISPPGLPDRAADHWLVVCCWNSLCC